jgi:hypothetical protein
MWSGGIPFTRRRQVATAQLTHSTSSTMSPLDPTAAQQHQQQQVWLGMRQQGPAAGREGRPQGHTVGVQPAVAVVAAACSVPAASRS